MAEARDEDGLALALNGTALVADRSGALYVPAHAALIVADLHLEKGSGLARRGSLLPPYDSRATLAALAAAIERRRPERVICLGDSFHDRQAAARLDGADAAMLRALIAGREWLWLLGNHDPLPPEGLGGAVADELVLGGLVLRHQARPGRVAGEISGHYHPKARLSWRGQRVGGRCFVAGRERVILPAFGAYAGGLDVLEPAISGLFAAGFHALLLGRRRLARFSAAQLRSAG
jgi:DNA ligase-associated metallophosphoesterase